MDKLRSSNIVSEEFDRSDGLQVRSTTNNQFLRIVKHRLPLIIAVTLGVSGIVGLWTLIQPPKYRSKFQLSIEREVDRKDMVKAERLQSTKVDYATKIEILRSRGILEPIIEIISVKYPEINYQTLISGDRNSALKIEQLKNTEIIEVFYEDKNPEKIKYVLDNLAAGYLNYSLQVKKNAIDSALAHLEEKLLIASKKLRKLQAKQLLFKQKYNLLDPKQQAEILSKKIIELEEKYFNTQVELNEKKSLYLILEKQLGQNIQTALASSHLSESTRYQELLDRVQEIDIKLVNGAAIWKESSPTIASLQEKKAKLLALLDRQARASVGNNVPVNLEDSLALTSASSLRLKLNQQFILAANEIEILRFRSMALAEAIRTVNQKIEQMPSLVSEYNELERQLNLATQSLQNLLSKKEELQLESAKQTSIWQPISRAELPEKPISPDWGKILGMSFVAGISLGSIAALLADRSDLLSGDPSTDTLEQTKVPI